MGVNLLAGEWLTLAPFQIGRCRLPINLALVTRLRWSRDDCWVNFRQSEQGTIFSEQTLE